MSTPDEHQGTSTSEGAATAAHSDSDLARIAYEAVESIPFVEPNDGNRLGYHIYCYLTGRIASLEEAVKEAKARTAVATNEILETVRHHLADKGVGR